MTSYPKLEKHLSATPPHKLYHYTSTEAFRCIIEYKKLWATDAFYMNDQKEILHAIELFLKACRAIAAQLKGRELDFLQSLMREMSFQGNDQPHIFTVSFSGNRDQLSQWRAYTRNGGYAISMNSTALSHIANTQGYRLARCVYREEEKKEIVEEFLNAKMRESAKEQPDVLAMTSANDFLLIAAMMKHEGFSEENEWRLISNDSRMVTKNIRYRSASKYLIPYLEIQIDTKAIPQKNHHRDYIGVDEVLVGPAPEPELSWRSCVQLLIDRNIYFEQITPSATPYRAN